MKREERAAATSATAGGGALPRAASLLRHARGASAAGPTASQGGRKGPAARHRRDVQTRGGTAVSEVLAPRRVAPHARINQKYGKHTFIFFHFRARPIQPSYDQESTRTRPIPAS